MRGAGAGGGRERVVGMYAGERVCCGECCDSGKTGDSQTCTPGQIIHFVSIKKPLLCLLFGWHLGHWDVRARGLASRHVQLSVCSASGAHQVRRRGASLLSLLLPCEADLRAALCGLMNEQHSHPLHKHMSCLLLSACPLSWERKVKNSKDW